MLATREGMFVPDLGIFPYFLGHSSAMERSYLSVADIQSHGTTQSGLSRGSFVCPFKGSSTIFVNIQGSSFWDIVKRDAFSHSCFVLEASVLSIPMVKDVILKTTCLSAIALVYHFSGLWPRLLDLGSHIWKMMFLFTHVQKGILLLSSKFQKTGIWS